MVAMPAAAEDPARKVQGTPQNSESAESMPAVPTLSQITAATGFWPT